MIKYKDSIISQSDSCIDDFRNIGVYIIKNTINNNVYIGSSKSLNRGMYQRISEHYSGLTNNTHCNKYLQNHVNKYGIETLRFSILELCTTEICESREQYYIDLYNSGVDGFNMRKYVDLSLTGNKCYSFIPIDEKTVVDLYTNHYMSCGEIGNILGVHKSKINSTLRSCGIKISSKYDRMPIKQLYYEYRFNEETIGDIANRYNCDRNTLCNCFKKLGYPIFQTQLLTEERHSLILKYIAEGNTVKSYCDKFPINYTLLNDLLNKYEN